MRYDKNKFNDSLNNYTIGTDNIIQYNMYKQPDNKLFNTDNSRRNDKYINKYCTNNKRINETNIFNVNNSKCPTIKHDDKIIKKYKCTCNQCMLRPPRLSCYTTTQYSKRFEKSVPISIISQQIDVTFVGYTTINYYPWSNGSIYRYGKIVFDCVVSGINFDVRIIESTYDTILGELIGINQSGFIEFEFNLPIFPSRLSLQVRRNNSPGINPQIYGVNLLLA